MCGIVGYVGQRDATEVLLGGLARLEYRGYDSAGIAVQSERGFAVRKRSGPLPRLVSALAEDPARGTLGIGHTRWATHGAPSDTNAHPHSSEDGQVAIIHNGIIENYLGLRSELESAGHRFASETDSEVLVHLIEDAYRGDLVQAVRGALGRVRGAYALVVAHAAHRSIVAARTVSPLVLGVGAGEMFLASDVPALLPYTRQIVFLHDGDIAEIGESGYAVWALAGAPLQRSAVTVDWTSEAAERGGYPTFMLKEIYEQPAALLNTLGGRLHDESGEVVLELSTDPGRIDRIQIVACGTAYHAGLVGKYQIEQLARIPVEVEVASEYRYREPVVDPRTLVIAISQSGETIDTLEALRQARRGGAQLLAIVNAKGSSITREVGDVLYIHAGPEIGVASTKAYTAQLAAVLLLALWLGRSRGVLDAARGAEVLAELRRLPLLIEQVLQPERVQAVREVATRFASSRNYLFLGRGINAPSALEGALKLKEISYIHAEAYPAGEIKHGPIALVDSELPVFVVATAARLLDKTRSNIQEVAARRGQVIALLSDGDTLGVPVAAELRVPKTAELVSPLVNAIPLQLLAYYSAEALGRDADKPRNLAKSVTVE
jgi:glucosamine--fructose-6-phosphate aminotransferase (isomerizing)